MVLFRKTFIPITIILFFGCTESNSNLLIGSWKSSHFINKDEIEKSFGVRLDESVSLNLVIESNYFSNGRVNSGASFIFKYKIEGEEISINILLNQKGTWSVNDNIISITTTYSEVKGGDVLSRKLLANAPDIIDSFKYRVGQVSKFKIVNISEAEMEIDYEDIKGNLIFRKVDQQQ